MRWVPDPEGIAVVGTVEDRPFVKLALQDFIAVNYEIEIPRTTTQVEISLPLLR